MSLKILSANCRSLNGRRKRENVFDYLKKLNYDIYCLQETRFVSGMEKTVEKDWGGDCFFSCSGSESRGVAILFRKAFAVENKHVLFEEDGNYFLLEFITEEKKRFLLGCIYGPSGNDKPSANFFRYLQKYIDQFDCENIILCGDFNATLNQKLDCKCYVNEHKPETREAILELMNDKHLIDIFREMNPNVPAFTFDKKEGGKITKQSRLDFFLISESLWSCFTECFTLQKYKSDHSMITLSLKDEKLWEFDNALLSDEDFVQSIKSVIQTHVQEWFSHPRRGAVEFTDQKMLEILLEKIKEKCISYSSSGESVSYSSSEKNENSVNDPDTFFAQGTGVEEKESRNNLSGIIPRIKLQNGQFTDEQSVILRESRDYYRKMYRNVDDSLKDCNLQEYLPFSNIKKLSDENSRSLEGPITLKEAEKTLVRMKSDESPGSDGFTLRFFTDFWGDIGIFVVNSINHAYDADPSMLSATQRHGLITCLPKEDTPKHFLGNWRPISQLNAVYKIASGSIAYRIQQQLGNIICPDQTGFKHGRNEAENIRLVYDIMQYTEEENIPGLLLLVEIEKPLDSLSWSFIQKSLEFFNFGKSIRKWISLFHSKIATAVKQGTNISEAFYLHRGCREGDPLSPCLFRICAEILAIKLRESNDINGIKFLGREKKIFTFAGDTLILMVDGSKKSIESSLGILREFAEMSGIRVNLDKAKGIWLGSSKCCDFVLKTPNEALKLGEKTFQLHGIKFDTADLQNVCDMNFRVKLENIRKYILRHWKHKNSASEDHYEVLKTIVLPTFKQIFSTLPNPSDSLLEDLESEFCFFAKGGSHGVDIKTIMMSLKLVWVGDIVLERSTLPFDSEIKTIALCGKQNIKNRVKKVTNVFWREVLEAWLHFSEKSPEQKTYPSMEPLFYSKNILIGKKTFFYKSWFENNIVFVNDVLNEDGSIMKLEDLNSKYETELDSHKYEILRDAIEKWVRKKKVTLLKVNFSHIDCIKKFLWEPIFNSAVHCNTSTADVFYCVSGVHHCTQLKNTILSQVILVGKTLASIEEEINN